MQLEKQDKQPNNTAANEIEQDDSREYLDVNFKYVLIEIFTFYNFCFDIFNHQKFFGSFF